MGGSSLHLFYINLDARADRRSAMEAQLERLHLSAERVVATMPDTLPTSALEFCDPASHKLSWVSPAELACTFSHRSVWDIILKRGLSCAMVLEDDAVLSRTLGDRLPAIERAMRGLDVIRIETRSTEVVIGPPTASGEIDLRMLYSYHPGSAGYVISRRGAQKVLACDQLNVPLDDLLFDPRGPMFDRLDMRQIVPALCIAADVVSGSTDGANSSDLAAHGARRTDEMNKRRSRARAILRRLGYRAREETRQRLALLVRGATRTRVPFEDTLTVDHEP